MNKEVQVSEKATSKRQRKPVEIKHFCQFCHGVVAVGESDRLRYKKMDGTFGYLHASHFVEAVAKMAKISHISHEKSLRRIEARVAYLIGTNGQQSVLDELIKKHERLMDLKYKGNYFFSMNDVFKYLGIVKNYKHKMNDGETLETLLAACEAAIYQQIESDLLKGVQYFQEQIQSRLSVLSAVCDLCLRLGIRMRLFDVSARVNISEEVKKSLGFNTLADAAGAAVNYLLPNALAINSPKMGKETSGLSIN